MNGHQCGWRFQATRMCLISPQINWGCTLLLRGRLQIQHYKNFFSCYHNKVRPKRHAIEEGEVKKAPSCPNTAEPSPLLV